MTLAASAALVFLGTAIAAAQIGGKIVTGNPTPGTEQPAPPDLADRVTLTGCLRAAPKAAGATDTPDPNTPSDARFVLANAARVDRVPADTGGSTRAAGATASAYRLEGIDSQFSPFVGTTVEISGEVKARADSAPASSPTLVVEFVQKLAATCK